LFLGLLFKDKQNSKLGTVDKWQK